MTIRTKSGDELTDLMEVLEDEKDEEQYEKDYEKALAFANDMTAQPEIKTKNNTIFNPVIRTVEDLGRYFDPTEGFLYAIGSPLLDEYRKYKRSEKGQRRAHDTGMQIKLWNENYYLTPFGLIIHIDTIENE